MIFFSGKNPLLYQLPDTDGNLSEVKVGQEVYLSLEMLLMGQKSIKFQNYMMVVYILMIHYLCGEELIVFIIKQPPTNPIKTFQAVHIGKDVPKAKYWAVDKEDHHIGTIISQRNKREGGHRV